jgi:cell division protein FtsL
LVVAQEKMQYDQLAYDIPETGKKPSRKTQKAMPRQAKILAIFLVAVLFALGITVAGQYARLALKNYQVSQLKKDITAQKVENDGLQLEIDKLRSVSRIESIATNQLGMVKPENYAFMDYRTEGKVKVPTVGDATQGKPNPVAQKPSGNPVIQQVAQIFSNLFNTAQR